MPNMDYLFRPRGEGTAWLFRMATPMVLIGRENPRTGKPYRREIRESLGGLRDAVKARGARDIRLGAVRLEELKARGEGAGSLEEAMEIRASLDTITDEETRDTVEGVLVEQAKELAKKQGTDKALRWYKTATGERTPFATAIQSYKKDGGKGLSKSTLLNLDTAVREFKEFAGQDVCLEEVDRRMVARFVTEHLPAQKTPRAPDGPGPATIRKKVSQLAQVWRWAMQRGVLPYSKETPWDEQAPSGSNLTFGAHV